MTETQITKKSIIVINEVDNNVYGDLIFTDKEGNQYKIPNKRTQYFEQIIIPDMAVQLNYAEAHGREYIYSANQIKDKLPSPTTPQAPLIEAAKKMGAEVISEKPIIHDAKTRSMAISYAKDLAMAGKIELKDISAYADKFLEYINK